MNLDQRRIKVLYITGWGRSGSTILSSILGQIDGFFSVGELSYFGKRGLAENRLCGCGEPFSQCAIWQNVLREAYGGADQINPSIFMDFNESGCRTRHFPLLLTKAGQSYLYPRVQEGLNHLDKLYRAIQKITDCKVIVDSSKNPAYGKWLESIPSIDLHVIHIIRDPRASAYSWQRMKKQPDTDQLDYMHRMNIFKSSLLWDAYASMSELLWSRSSKYFRLRYEDFIADPQSSIAKILGLVGYSVAEMPFVAEKEVVLMPTHTISGNPNRFQAGPVSLRLDDEWRIRMKSRDKLAVTALTWPILIFYLNQSRYRRSLDV